MCELRNVKKKKKLKKEMKCWFELNVKGDFHYKFYSSESKS